MTYYISSNELYHHGVLGMKWGIRRYQPYTDGKKGKEVGEAAKAARTQDRGSAKIRRIDKKYQKQQAKVVKASRKADKKADSPFSSERSTEKAFSKLYKSEKKLSKLAYKGNKAVNKLEKKLSKMDVKLDSEMKDLGQKYLNQINTSASATYSIMKYKAAMG